MDGTKKRENKSLEFLDDTDFLNQPHNAITKIRDVQDIFFSLRNQCVSSTFLTCMVYKQVALWISSGQWSCNYVNDSFFRVGNSFPSVLEQLGKWKLYGLWCYVFTLPSDFIVRSFSVVLTPENSRSPHCSLPCRHSAMWGAFLGVTEKYCYLLGRATLSTLTAYMRVPRNEEPPGLICQQHQGWGTLPSWPGLRFLGGCCFFSLFCNVPEEGAVRFHLKP